MIESKLGRNGRRARDRNSISMLGSFSTHARTKLQVAQSSNQADNAMFVRSTKLWKRHVYDHSKQEQKQEQEQASDRVGCEMSVKTNWKERTMTSIRPDPGLCIGIRA